MRFRTAWIIAKKELRESLRDRKTLFLTIFLPILLYPVLMLIVSQVAVMQASKLEEQTSNVGYAGAAENNPLIDSLSLDERLELTEIASDDIGLGIAGLDVDVLLDLTQWSGQGEYPTETVVLHFHSVVDSSRQAMERVEENLVIWSDVEVARRLQQQNIDESFISPLNVESIDDSPPAQRGGYALAAILPILVIVTVLLGAFYPAIDLTAGEKERGSIQTLFTAPISTFEIVTGKYLAVLVIAMITGLANLASIALLFGQNLFLSSDVLGDIDFNISAPVILALLVTIFLMALFFSALLLTAAVLAKSYREGQSYVTPVYLICVIPSLVAQMPGFELTAKMAMIPAVNLTLLMKGVLVGGVTIEQFFAVVASTLIYTGLVLVAASKLFGQESVVLGERGDLKLLARRTPGLGRSQPTIGEGIALFGVLFVVLFYVGPLLQSRDLHWGLLGTEWLLILGPTVLLVWYLRLDLKGTFSLAPPKLRLAGASVLLGASAWIVVAWLNTILFEQTNIQAPPELVEELTRLLTVQSVTGMVWLIFVISITPAICEEVLFRGFIFSSMRDRVAPWALVLVTGLLFGAFHLSIFRLFGTTALGVIMGLLVYKSGSIWTSVIFHAINNAMAVVAFSVSSTLLAQGVFPTWVIGLGGAGTAVGLALVFMTKSPWAKGQGATS